MRQIEVLQGQGKSLAVACKEVGTTEQSYYRYRKVTGFRASQRRTASKIRVGD
jgi:hypothetical protein